MAAQVKQKDEAGAEKTLENWSPVLQHPDDWAQMIDVAMTTKGMRDIDYVWLGRLMLLTGAKITPQRRAAGRLDRQPQLALLWRCRSLPEAGGPAARPARQAADKKTIPDQIAAGPKQNGEYNVKLAEALYGYGMYPEAEAAAKLAKQKGGVKDPTEADMVIGQSLGGAGQV